jgi:predicted RNA-binding Zn-ribbon protein involved in translation (DUF1610 family)
MNEFSKEELLELIGWADYCVGSGLCYTETEPLYKKIQSMIDNYSDHECPSCGRKIISED